VLKTSFKFENKTFFTVLTFEKKSIKGKGKEKKILKIGKYYLL